MADVDRHIADVDWRVVPGESATIRLVGLLSATSTVVGAWSAGISRQSSPLVVAADGADLLVSLSADQSRRWLRWRWELRCSGALVARGTIGEATERHGAPSGPVTVALHEPVSVSISVVAVGPAGPVGPAGAQGVQGDPGPQGVQGPTGPAGTTEWSGITGRPSTFAPTVHASSHGVGGADPVTVDAAQITTGLIAGARSGQPSYAAGWLSAIPGEMGDTPVQRTASWWVPIELRAAASITGIGVLTHTPAASAGAVWRLGLYTVSMSTGEPNQLIIDGGTTAADAASTFSTVTFAAQSRGPGVVVVCAQLQGATTDPTMRCPITGEAGVRIPRSGNPSRNSNEIIAAWRGSAVAGALPASASSASPAPTSVNSNLPPQVWIQFA